MGSTELTYAKPVRTVDVDGFYIDKYEVTNGNTDNAFLKEPVNLAVTTLQTPGNAIMTILFIRIIQ